MVTSITCSIGSAPRKKQGEENKKDIHLKRKNQKNQKKLKRKNLKKPNGDIPS